MLAAVCFGVLLVAAVVSVWPRDFSPGEELISPGAKDIAVSQEDKVYPTSDRLRFDGGPEVVYVYLRVEDFATYEDLEARVGRTSRVSAQSWTVLRTDRGSQYSSNRSASSAAISTHLRPRTAAR